MLKKMTVLVAMIIGVVTLTGCEFTTGEVESVIEQCKQDPECKALIDEQIDAALEERGMLLTDNYFNTLVEYNEDDDWFEFFDDEHDEEDIWCEIELTDEEERLLEILFALEDELFNIYDSYTNEEYLEFELDYLEEILGRELTEEEQNAFEIVNDLYNTLDIYYDDYVEIVEDTDVDPTIDSLVLDIESYDEEAFLEEALGRELTEEEQNALTLVQTINEEAYSQEIEVFEFTLESLVLEYEEVLGRELNDDEVKAIETFYFFE